MRDIIFRKSEFLYLTAFAILVFKISLGNTTFVEFIDNKSIIWKSTSSLPYALIIFKILFQKLSLKNIVSSLIVFICFFITFYCTVNTEIITLAILLIGIQNVAFKKVVVTHFYVYGFVMISALVASILDITEMYKIESNVHGIRYALGSTYPTDFSAGILYLLLSFIYFTKIFKLRYFIIWFCIVTITFIFTKARTDFLLCLILLLSKTFVCHDRHLYPDKILIYSYLRRLSIIIFPLLFILSYISVLFFNNGNSFIHEVNVLLNYRIGFISNFLSDYNINLFGNQIIMTGSGFGTSTGQDYSFLDNGYFFTLLRNGVVITFFIIIGFSLVAFKSSNIVINYILVFIAINALIEPRFISFEYNPFLLLIGIVLLNNRKYVS